MLKRILSNMPGVRQAMWFADRGPFEVATTDGSFSPTEAAGQLEALRAIEHLLPLGEFQLAAFADGEVSATFHQREGGVVVLVTDPEPESLGAHALALHHGAVTL